MKKFVLIAMFLGLSACSNLMERVLEKPQVDFQRSYVQDAGLQGATLVLVFNVKNPNGVELKLDELNYKVFLNEKPFTEARSQQVISVPAKSEAPVEIPVPFRYANVFSGALDLFTAQKVSYKVEGDARFASLFRIPFSESGEYKMNE